MTFEVKLLITFVATDPLVILTKFSGNRIKHVAEEANCEKEERRKKSQERNKLGSIPSYLKKEERKKKLEFVAVTDGVRCRGDPKLTPDWYLIH